MRKIVPFLCLFALLLSGCGGNWVFDAATEAPHNVSTPSADDMTQVPPSLTPPTEPAFNMEDYKLITYYDNSDTQYMWNNRGLYCVLYVLGPSDDEPQELAVLTTAEENPDSSKPIGISQFWLCGDWILMSLSRVLSDSGGSVSGDFARLKKDGSDLSYFCLPDSELFVGEDWIYYNKYESGQSEGCYRMRADGTEEEDMSEDMTRILGYDPDDGYLFYEYAECTDYGWSLVRDLRRCLLDGSAVVTLFDGASLPYLDECRGVDYFILNWLDGWVEFMVTVDRNYRGDGELYTAFYRVRKDGSELTLKS